MAFTRDPATGEKVFFGEWLPNAQGEDVVAGIRTPQPINLARKGDSSLTSMEEAMPETYRELEKIYQRLEKHFKNMQDIEFTVQQGKLWMLQTRTGKRTAFSALRIAVEMVEEKLIDKKTAVKRLDPYALNQLLAPIFDPQAKKDAIKGGRYLAKGLNAGPGAACGRAVFTPEKAMELAKKGEKSVLVRIETSPEDIHGMNAAEGILTSRGGMTSHAALVARGMGKPCVVGCAALNINYAAGTMEVNGRTIREGDFLSIDGTTGEVIEGADSHQFLGNRPGSHRKEDPAEGFPDLPAFRQAHVLGGRNRGHRRAHQRGHAPRRHGRPSLRRHRHRSLPHGAHVLPGRTYRGRPRNDPGGHPRGAPPRPGQDPAHAAGGLHRHLPGHGRLSGHHPHPGPAPS